ncbi:MAG: hypothetical protein IJ079_10005 [Lachnospiraceae bacterium]|nr:hypothetical protein [Lachnospiraceae bacterium]
MQNEMLSKGYILQQGKEDSDVQISIYAPKDSDWVTVASEDFQFIDDNDTKKIGTILSETFQTDVLAVSCVDSDYLFMHLLNVSDQTDGWINIGRPYSGKLPRRTGLIPWKNKVSDYEKLKSISKQNYTFAEEALLETGALLGLQKEQCIYEPDHAEDTEQELVTNLYYSLPESSHKDLPRLKIDRFTLTPCVIGRSKCVFVSNKGGKSKGIAIEFVGDYIKDDSLIIENVTFESDYGSERRKITPIELKKVKASSGNWVLYWEDKDFVIPPAVNRALPPAKYNRLEYEREFGVRFTVKGNPRKVLDVTVFIIPLENTQKGSDCWFVYRHSRTKAQYIEDYNNSVRRNQTIVLDEELLKSEDYDL